MIRQDKVRELIAATRNLVTYIEQRSISDTPIQASEGQVEVIRSDRLETLLETARRLADDLGAEIGVGGYPATLATPAGESA